MVGLNGLEPSTSRLSGVHSNHLSYRPTYGGGKEIRTPDPLRARQVLSQLSYTPIFNRCSYNAYYFIKKLFRCQYFFVVFCRIWSLKIKQRYYPEFIIILVVLRCIP